MQCEICGQVEANVNLKQVCNGDVKEMNVCEQCARQNGLCVESPSGLTDFLFGMGPAQSENEPTQEQDIECGHCHMHLSDLRKTSRLGCPACYDTFRGELAPLLADMHRGPAHVGKVPGGERGGEEIVALQKELAEAVASQNFEEAARLRDRVNVLEAARPEQKTA